ncbi:hypothetical protein [Solibacillus sp. FSL H8-0538]|uniref:hypothetical protein n=1 Tax=Solibacillus sp. FSL H8-0538 TaxID=2921400 RepID=UPI0030F58694
MATAKEILLENKREMEKHFKHIEERINILQEDIATAHQQRKEIKSTIVSIDLALVQIEEGE